MRLDDFLARAIAQQVRNQHRQVETSRQREEAASGGPCRLRMSVADIVWPCWSTRISSIFCMAYGLR